jgi:hypothetical protein
MEENKNSGVDMSNYMDSKKKVVVGRALPKNKNESKNRIYLAIIVACILIMAMLWAYYNK